MRDVMDAARVLHPSPFFDAALRSHSTPTRAKKKKKYRTMIGVYGCNIALADLEKGIEKLIEKY